MHIKVGLLLIEGHEDATSLDAMHSAAVGGSDIPRLVPHERWTIDSSYAPEVTVDKMYLRHAGFLQGVQDFDAAAFRHASLGLSLLSYKQACMLCDLARRLTLEETRLPRDFPTFF